MGLRIFVWKKLGTIEQKTVFSLKFLRSQRTVYIIYDQIILLIIFKSQGLIEAIALKA